MPEHLPAVDEVVEPEEVAAAPVAWRHIGEEITEQLDYQAARFFRRRIIRRKYVKRDESPIEYLSPGNGQTKQGYFWACKRPGADVSFVWQTSRAARCLEHITPAGFQGTMQCDGYSAYPSFANRSEGRFHPGRVLGTRPAQVFETTESAPQQADWPLLQIQHL